MTSREFLQSLTAAIALDEETGHCHPGSLTMWLLQLWEFDDMGAYRASYGIYLPNTGALIFEEIKAKNERKQEHGRI